ncbi:ferredoxin [Streptomyces sp. NBC_01240]|uniref:ferredoxin n=1 Tax=Streptomyces sp. NBC_01240 TaxID=2903793 RepID=UPI002E0F7210|nr:ferredoxin [Streptomyces sp. NBC_01240]
MPREDNRLTDGAPMCPLSCLRCGNQVRVRKSSWQQTSVQWDAKAMLGCPERQAGGSGEGPNGGAFEGCRSLGDTIREAALIGAITVLQE